MRMLYSRGERKLLIADGSTYFEHDLLADTEARTPREEYRDEPLIRLLLYGESPEQLFLLDRYRQDDREIFRFRPRDRDDYHIELTLGEDGLPNFLEVISQDGEGTRFFFETFDLNAQFPDDHFTIPPAAEPR
jgi:outer membrane lipoprotein-sorting protein